MDPVVVLAYIAILFLAGVLCAFLSKQVRIPYNLVLILLGLLLGSLVYNGVPLLQIDKGFVFAIGLLVLIMMVFDSTARVRLKENKLEAVPALKLINNFTLLSIVIVTFFVSNSFFPSPTLEAVLYSLLFSILVIETDLGSVLLLFRDFAKERAKHILYFLETEANLNTAFVLVLPFILLSLIGNVDFTSQSLLGAIFGNLHKFIYEVLIGIGIGIIIGLLLLKILRNWFDEGFSPIVLVAACLVSFVFATLLGGNGIVAVAVMGLFFGSSYVAGKEQLGEFSKMLHSSLEILVLVLLGFTIRPPVSATYVFESLLIFAAILSVRLLSVFLALQREPFTAKEKVFIGLNMPKGLALATVLLVFSTFGMPNMDVILQLALMVMIYSIAFSYIMDFHAEKLLGEKVRAHAMPGINVLEAPAALEHPRVVHRQVAPAKKPARKATAKKAGKATRAKSRASKGKKAVGKAKKRKGSIARKKSKARN